jgi:hypothetical protein
MPSNNAADALSARAIPGSTAGDYDSRALGGHLARLPPSPGLLHAMNQGQLLRRAPGGDTGAPPGGDPPPGAC